MTTTPVTQPPSLAVSGAVPAPGVDAPVAWHFGDPLAEQRALRTAAGVIDRSTRDVLQVTGPDRLPWLHSICSQHLSELADGTATQALVLSPHGHVEQHWQVAELAATVWIDTEPRGAEAVLGYLQRMVFLKRVEPADVSGQWAMFTVAGAGRGDALAGAGLAVPEPGAAVPLPGGGFARGRTGPTGPEVDLVVPRADATDTFAALQAAGARPVGSWAYDALRVEARLPRIGFETDHRTIPHEVGWIGSAVHLNKGCYRGQETVARVHNLGRPPRRLVLLHLSGESDELPPPGTPAEVDARAIGFLGTAVQHHELGPIALAVVKRTVPDGSTVTVAGSPATVD